MLPWLLLLTIGTASADDDCDTLTARLEALRELALPCATPAMHAALREHPRCLVPVRAPEGGMPRDGTKLVRDAWGGFNVYETDNFAIKWGSDTSTSALDRESLGAGFEAAWAVELEAQGYPPPSATETWKFNVYLGSSGMGTPDDYGAAGYFWYDDDGYPMIVVADDHARDREAAAATAAHEFFHAVQDAVGTIQYDDRGAWYQEATAMWMENQVRPQDPAYAGFLWYFAARPELPLNHFDYPDTGTIEEYHQYGAMAFVHLLDTEYGGWQLIRRSFVEAPLGGDPMEELDDLLAEDGHAIDEVFFDFAGRCGTWDFAHGEWFQYYVDAWGGGQSHRIAGSVDGLTDEWVLGTSWLPRTYGANYWEIGNLPEDVTVRFEGNEGPARWYAALAWQEGDTHGRHVIDLVDGSGSVHASDVRGMDELVLVVAATDTWVDRGDSWAYAFRIDAYEPGDTGLDDTGGEEPRLACGCGTGGAEAGWIGLIGLIGLIGRRRRT